MINNLNQSHTLIQNLQNFILLSSDNFLQHFEGRPHALLGSDPLHNAYIEQLDSSVYKIDPYIILSYIL